MTGSDGVMTEVMTPSNPCSTTVLDTVSQPVTTFLPKHSQNTTVCAESEKVDIPGIFENQGSDTCLDNTQNPSEQSLEGVTTFPHRGWDTPPKLEKITDEDAQNLRDIALLWWSEYYPEQIQGLITQMYGWQAPGTKYDGATLAEWLEGEDELIRDRITELIHRREE